ncbi:NADH dehydrogenase subunit 3 (mitochondrion) [Hyalella azteca]|uniref:NADH-ubiquinone oxidoreductase chain 3 n=1 Tax=Hyalella azteca TaxID=294128 RepID=A0A385UKV5_HYAAZ|nr:NADH dehydrogenase subunit 3 [Hyalella azteca]AYB71621.1 NADH dehydrogenase subunit 3 [Hyalella azteca]
MLNLALLYFFVSSLVLCLALGVGVKSDKGREKTSPFECGFDPFKSSRVPFSIRFFLVTVIFLVFDVEVALLLPLGLLKTSADPLFVALSGLILIMVLVLGLLHEWNQGALNWIY